MHGAGHHGVARSHTLAVITVSDTRTLDTDESGRILEDLCRAAGHAVSSRIIVPDEPDRVRQELGALVKTDVDAVLINGGTGISERDRTYDAVSGMMDKRLDGFGELFRWLSYQQIGAAAMLSRAVAGLVSGKPVFSMPGSPAAVRLAAERLILPELSHVIGEAVKKT